MPREESLDQRLGTHLAIAAAVVVTDVGVGLMFGAGGSTWVGVAGVVAHVLAIGVVVFAWLPLSAWLARWIRLPEVAAEGLMIVVLGLLVGGVELGLLRGPDTLKKGHSDGTPTAWLRPWWRWSVCWPGGRCASSLQSLRNRRRSARHS